MMGETGIYKRFEKYEWIAANSREDAWVMLEWNNERTISGIAIYGSAVQKP